MNYNESWAEIENFPRYQISSYGQVLGIKTISYLKPQFNGRYFQLSLCNDQGCVTKLIHRLVAAAFIGSIPEGLTVNHIDGNKLNNYVENLEIVTQLENIRHAIATGLKRTDYSSKRVVCLETEEIFESGRDAARHFNVWPSEISTVLHGNRPHVRGYHFEFVD